MAVLEEEDTLAAEVLQKASELGDNQDELARYESLSSCLVAACPSPFCRSCLATSVLCHFLA